MIITIIVTIVFPKEVFIRIIDISIDIFKNLRPFHSILRNTSKLDLKRTILPVTDKIYAFHSANF